MDNKVVSTNDYGFATYDYSYGNSTRFLAILNFDWDIIKPFHIYKSITSVFDSDSLRYVKLFCTKDGKEKMVDEEINGPKFDKEISPAEYLFNRRSYYMAIAEFNTVEAAEKVYELLDAVEFDQTNNYYDIRFVTEEYIEKNLTNAVQTCVDEENVEYEIFMKDIKKDDYEWEGEGEREAFLNNLFQREDYDSNLVDDLIDISGDEADNKVEQDDINEKNKSYTANKIENEVDEAIEQNKNKKSKAKKNKHENNVKVESNHDEECENSDNVDHKADNKHKLNDNKKKKPEASKNKKNKDRDGNAIEHGDLEKEKENRNNNIKSAIEDNNVRNDKKNKNKHIDRDDEDVDIQEFKEESKNKKIKHKKDKFKRMKVERELKAKDNLEKHDFFNIEDKRFTEVYNNDDFEIDITDKNFMQNPVLKIIKNEKRKRKNDKTS